MKSQIYIHFIDFYSRFLYDILTYFVPAVFLSVFVSVCIYICGFMNDLSRRSRSGGFFRFVAAFGLVGSVSGTIAGGSVEGLVGAVFATILGLVSSLLGYLFSRESLSQWRPVIPLAISSLLVNSLLGLSIGGVKRVQREINMVEIRKAESEFKEVYLPVEKQRRLDMVQKCIGELPLEEAIQACK